MLCCETPISFIMSKTQTTSASSLSVFVFFLVRSVVLAVVEAFGIETANFTAAGDELQPVAFDERRTADALQRPIVYAASRQLFAAMLPEELAVLRCRNKGGNRGRDRPDSA